MSHRTYQARCTECLNIFPINGGQFHQRCKECEDLEQAVLSRLTNNPYKWNQRKERSSVHVKSFRYLPKARRRIRQFRPYNALAVIKSTDITKWILRYREPDGTIQNKGRILVPTSANDVVHNEVRGLITRYIEKSHDRR